MVSIIHQLLVIGIAFLVVLILFLLELLTYSIETEHLAGGLDKLTLDTPYDEAIARANQNGTNTVEQVASNPFEAASLDWYPFSASSSTATPCNVPMEDMIQQQHFITQQQEQQQQELPLTGQDATNPFRNPFLDQSLPSHSAQDSFSGLIWT